MADLKNEDNIMNPQEYFNTIKGKIHSVDDEQLKLVYLNCLELLTKYRITGQTKGIKKLMFHIDCVEKERKIVSYGINRFVYRDDIEFYINQVADDAVKIIDIESYEREIPDDVVKIIERVKGLFDQLYIVFTDYTGEVERQVQEERREKDPILFGVFQNTAARSVIDRFYYLADWVDEYCDLTLDKMVNETAKAGHRNIEHVISTPSDLAELKEQIGKLETRNDRIIISENKKPTFFDRVRTFLGMKK